MIAINSQKLIGFVADIFRVRASKAEAERIATYLTTANLTGHDSHGVIRVPQYVKWAKEGVIVPDQTIAGGRYAFNRSCGWRLRLRPDGNAAGGENRYRQVQGQRAVGHDAEKFRASGRVGDWAEMAAAEGLISIYFVNAAGSVLVAYGGVGRKLSTAPYCVGIPRPGRDRWCWTSRLPSLPKAR
jgi:uncharacterized oxidoreductase